ncbi:hypothetical protein NM208_g733 [Fusarium decemcellulare]|uniref:Uncharacterized protein n=2 Tax=Fusarium decemcellulare TaxID=57161 RepID=A0ACC1SK16_9HYPO|nr:hypothetical protein NM208_g4627 [Fusarium decemcellulare]KAJ3548970.1 hypothetical protein NM208_g733 [Fusarium decemcellulare]
MASLVHWPRELLLLTLERLSTADLSSVSMVNKYFRNVAEPILYAQVDLPWDKTNSGRPPIVLLLRTILDRPKVADLIHRMSLLGDDLHGERPRRYPSPPLVDTTLLQMDEAEDMIRRTKLAYAESWVKAVRDGSMDAVVCLLLLQLSRLRFLHVQVNFTKVNKILGMILRAALFEPSRHQLPTYEHLREVDFSQWPRERKPKDYKNTQDVLPFVYLPHIRDLSIGIDDTDELNWPSHPPTSTSIQSLKLSKLREGSLGTFLSGFTSLRKLQYDWGCQNRIEVTQDPDLHLDKMASAVSQLGGTLEELIITLDRKPDGSHARRTHRRMNIHGSPDALTGLCKLRWLSIPWLLLMGHLTLGNLRDVLPKHLESLTLTDDIPHRCWRHGRPQTIIVDKVEGELEYRQMVSSNLRHISLQLAAFDVPPDTEVGNRLELKAAQASIELVWPSREMTGSPPQP